MSRGFYAIGIQGSKTAVNVGTLWRSASIFGAAFMFTVGKRFPKQASDTIKAWKRVPMFEFESVDDLRAHLPLSTRLIGVELDGRAKPVARFSHPERACYLLGSEDRGLTPEAREACHSLVQLPGEFCLNVAVAGSLIAYDRLAKGITA